MVLTEEELKQNYAKLADVIERYRNKKGPLMPVMQAAQDIFGYISFDVQNYIAEELGIPLTDVYGVSTFYSQFSLEPKGKHVIGVCMGTACYVKGAQAVLDKLKDELGVEVGKTTEDGRFTLEATRCLGCCGLAPVVMIGDDVYGNLTANDIPEILNKYR
jgi:NADH-quinone oxidoreductase E subunit